MRTAEAIMDSLRRARPVCGLCGGASGHEAIVGDGPPVCYVCVLALGRMAGFPREVETDRLATLSVAHGDVVELRPCEKHGECWSWTGWA